jgi:hypothetical protein
MKHIDFVLSDRDTLQVHCLVELDDGSHQSADRRRRDAFVDRACAAAGVPLLRFPAKAGYSVQSVRAALESVIRFEAPAAADDRPPGGAPPPAVAAAAVAAPPCPRCGGATVLRTVKSGAHAGTRLWGCSTYPTCRGFVPL